ncbi:MAG: hypothetical protein CMG93_05055 [Marinomonas sp.]|nr:hypothetical protein [Marinomonas sp.]
MKKVTLTAALLGSVLLTGCQSLGMGDNTSLADVDFEKMSCSEIKQTFVSYQEHMDTLETGSGLLASVGMNSGTDTAKATMNSAYLQAKKTATPIMKVKGCTETI